MLEPELTLGKFLCWNPMWIPQPPANQVGNSIGTHLFCQDPSGNVTGLSRYCVVILQGMDTICSSESPGRISLDD